MDREVDLGLKSPHQVDNNLLDLWSGKSDKLVVTKPK